MLFSVQGMAPQAVACVGCQQSRPYTWDIKQVLGIVHGCSGSEPSGESVPMDAVMSVKELCENLLSA